MIIIVYFSLLHIVIIIISPFHSYLPHPQFARSPQGPSDPLYQRLSDHQADIAGSFRVGGLYDYNEY